MLEQVNREIVDDTKKLEESHLRPQRWNCRVRPVKCIYKAA